MSENNQIQEISEYIDGVKKLIFKEVFKGVLDSKDAPFSSEVDVYLKELVNSDITDPYKIGIVSLEKQGTNYVVSLSGPFKSYIEVNGVASQFNKDGEINNLTVPVFTKTGEEDDDFLAIVNFAYSETKPANYTATKTPQEIINEYSPCMFLYTNHSKTEPNIGVIEKFDVPVEKLNIDVFWNQSKNRFEVINHMKTTIKFSVLNKEYTVKKGEVAKIIVDWNAIKNLNKLPFSDNNRVHFENTKNQNIGQIDLSEIADTSLIANANFLFGNQFSPTFAYNDNTGKVIATVKDNSVVNKKKEKVYIKGLNPEFSVFSQTLDKTADGVYSKEFNIDDVKSMPLAIDFTNQTSLPYNKNYTQLGFDDIRNLLPNLNGGEGNLTDLKKDLTTSKHIKYVLYSGEPYQKVFDIDMGLEHSNFILSKLKSMIHPIMYRSIDFMFRHNNCFIRPEEEGFFGDSQLEQTFLQLALNPEEDWSAIDPDIVSMDFNYIRDNVTYEENVANNTFKVKIADTGNKFNENPLVACYNQEVYSMTKQADGSFVSEDIPMVHRNDEVQFSVSQEIWNIMLGLYQRDPWGRQ